MELSQVASIFDPRMKLCAAVLSCHLREKMQRELDWHFESVYHMVDSTIVRHQNTERFP